MVQPTAQRAGKGESFQDRGAGDPRFEPPGMGLRRVLKALPLPGPDVLIGTRAPYNPGFAKPPGLRNKRPKVCLFADIFMV